MHQKRRFLIAIGAIGIGIELIAVALLGAKTVPVAVGIPIIIAGMFIALVPMFALSRMRRDR